MTTDRARWVLASASPRRSEILRGLGLKFSVSPSSALEPPPGPNEPPARYATQVARMKVRDVAARRGSGLIVGADTIVVAGTEVLGKPSSEREGRAMLRALNGRWHEVITGVALMDCATGRMASGFTSSKVHFRRMSSREISWYIATGEYRDKAGAYGVQGYAALFIDRIEGCYFNIVGFPVALFEKLCRKLGVDLLGHSTAGC